MHPDSSASTKPEILLRAVALTKSYRRGRWFVGTSPAVQALCGASLDLHQGSTLGLVGASGAGKSTLARCLAGIEPPDSGEIWFEGEQITRPVRRTHSLSSQVQMVFQDATGSLSPRLNALEIVSEPLLIAGERKQERGRRALELMQLVGLPRDSATKLACEFSTGQRRRLAIARALALQPKVLILDEALAGLDLSIRAQISNLLLEIQAAFSLSCICVSHDLDLVAHLADKIAMIDRGKIVATLAAEDFAVGRLKLPRPQRQGASAPPSTAGAGAP